MPSTYEPIATTTLGSAASSVTFSSITGSYTDLVLVATPIYSTTAATKLYINNDSTSVYSGTWLYGTGSAAGSYRVSNTAPIIVNYFNNASSDIPNQIINFQNYSNATTFKTFLARNNNAAQGTDAVVGLWRSTSAITQLELQTTTGNYSVGSTFTLYGIKAA
jgi:hypothetical protein